jgi:hypothetical protein
MALHEIVSGLVAGIVQISHHGEICDGRPLADRERIALQVLIEDGKIIIEAWIDGLAGWYAQELKAQPEIHIACYEAFLAAARTARHRPIVMKWFETWRQSSELALKAAGSARPREHAELFVSALVGMLLEQLAAPQRGFQKEVKAALSELVGSLVGGA